MPASHDTAFYPALDRYFKARLAESSLIEAEREKALERVLAYIAEKLSKGQSARLTFICTHNARRSQMAQIWAQAAAQFFGVPGVSAFSGGTAASAFDHRAISAMVRAGFRIEPRSTEDNPVYLAQSGSELPPIRAFSKTLLDPTNPRDGYCAVMTCSSADRDCPVIPGADKRVLLPYEDPGSSDGTDREKAVYDERCQEICREMGWVFARVGSA